MGGRIIDWKEIAYWLFGYGVGVLTGMTYLFIALRDEQETNKYLLAQQDDPAFAKLDAMKKVREEIITPTLGSFTSAGKTYQQLADARILDDE